MLVSLNSVKVVTVERVIVRVPVSTSVVVVVTCDSTVITVVERFEVEVKVVVVRRVIVLITSEMDVLVIDVKKVVVKVILLGWNIVEDDVVSARILEHINPAVDMVHGMFEKGAPV